VNRDIYSDPEAKAEWEALGIGVVPCAVQGDRSLIILHMGQLRQFLDLPPSDSSSSYQEWVAAMNRVLEAVEEAVRQVPSERLSDPTPNRGRDLRELVYNIHDRVPFMCQALETGWYDYHHVDDFGPSRRFQTSEELAEFCREVRTGWLECVREVDDDTSLNGVDSRQGEATHQQLLEIQAFHAAQHLRQIYTFMRQIGVEPARELTVEEMAPVELGEDVF
jgi:hypothetical protein